MARAQQQQQQLRIEYKAAVQIDIKHAQTHLAITRALQALDFAEMLFTYLRRLWLF